MSARPTTLLAGPQTTMPVGTVSLPTGRVIFTMYPRLLLRATGFEVAALLDLAGTGPAAGHTAAEDTSAEYAAARESSLRTLRSAFGDPRLREAVAQNNPGFHDIAFAPGRALVTDAPYPELTKHGRRQVRTAHRYLRRLLGKTETNAFFGPTLAAGWDPGLETHLIVGRPVPERCVTGLSHWVVRELTSRHRRALPAAARPWRRDPLWCRDGTGLRRTLDGRRLVLTDEADAVWHALRTPATPAVLMGRTALGADAVRDALRQLAPALRPWPEPPATLIDGIGWLTREGIAGDTVPRLSGLLSAAGSPWPRAHEVRREIRAEIASLGLGTARAAGRHYADRDVINEDRSSPWNGRVSFGAPAIAAAHRMLAGVIPLFLLAALTRQADAREAVTRHTGGTAAGLVELAAAEIEPVSRRTDRLHAVLADVVPSLGCPVEVRLSRAELNARLGPLWAALQVADDDQLAALPGFDLMVEGGPPGKGRWVLSECHDDSSSAIGGITSRVRPAEGPGFDDFGAMVTGWLDTTRMATVVGRRRSRHITPELPGLSIELSGVSAKPAGQVIPAAEVRVAADATRVLCDGRGYQLYPGDVSGPLFTALSLPCLVPVPFATGRAYTPRIVLGDVVVQRRRWVLDTSAEGQAGPARRETGTSRGETGFGRGETGFRAVRDWRAEHGLPDRVFLRHPDEPKPLLIDFRDPLSVEDLTRLRPAAMVCSEVLPDLPDTWWRAGGSQPAELRLPVFLRWERSTS